MKKTIITLLVISFSLSAFAQKHDRTKRIKALKVAHISEKLNLTENEAQKFWPIYNAYDSNVFKLKHESIREIRHEIKEKADTLTEERADELLNQLTDFENDLHKEKIQLINKLQKIISSKKIILLIVAEESFKRKLFEQFRNHRPERKKN